jgi:hypothetical protein
MGPKTRVIDRIFKVIVGFNDAGGIHHLDTIEYEGTLWFVPHWIENPAEQWKTPVRIVSVANLQYQRGGGAFGDFVMNEPLSKAILDGQNRPEEGSRYTVIESPDIRVSTKKLN